jgi:NAD(P)-dependent dehydrogenase (short-subunit alcohol dehydrogenase family)
VTIDERKVWVVTGGSRGFGRAVAERAAAAGARVAIIARGTEVEEAARAIGGETIGLVADVCDADRIAAVFAAIADRWGRIDVLVNNAGLHRGGLIEQIDAGDWAAVLATNLSGPFNTIRSALPLMSEQSSIVNVGAVVGFRGFSGDVAYGTSKSGLAGMTQVLAVELARRGIRINLVVPGFVDTDMTAALSARARARLLQRIPLGRPGTLDEIAEVICWVAEARYMTGSIVATDGGLMCSL